MLQPGAATVDTKGMPEHYFANGNHLVWEEHEGPRRADKTRMMLLPTGTLNGVPVTDAVELARLIDKAKAEGS